MRLWTLLAASVILILSLGCGSGVGNDGAPFQATTVVLAGPSTRIARDVASFPDGSLLLAGEFVSELVVGAGEPNETTLTGANSWTLVLARHAQDGSLIWAESATTNSGNGVQVATLPDLSCLAAGAMIGNVTFGAGQAGETTFDTGGTYWSYVAHYASDGTLLWVKAAHEAFVYDVAAYSDGSFATCGHCRPGSTFGPGEPNETIVTSPSYTTDLFVARYAADGTFLRLSRAGGGALGANHWAFSIAAVPDGSCLVTGYMRDGCTFGEGEANETTFSVPGDFTNPFVARYDTDGALLWARNAECASYANGTAIAAFSDGSSVITGRLNSAPITFGPGEVSETTLPDIGLYVARYTPDGDLAWAKAMESARGFDQHCGIAALPDGSAVVAGHASDVVVAGAGEPNETMLPWGAFLGRLDPDGSLVWARSDPAPAGRVTAVCPVSAGAYAWCGTGVASGADLAFEDGTVFPAQPGDRTLFVAVRSD